MGKLGVLYVITELYRGGAEKNLSYLVRSVQENHRVTVVCLYGDGEVAGELRDAGVDVRCLGFRKAWQFYRIRRLARMMREFEPDIVHTFLIHANIAGRIAARLAGVPATISSVRVAERQRRRHLVMDRWTNNLVAVEVCNSEAVKRFMVEEARVPEEKLVVIPNGIEASDYEVTSLPEGAPVVAFVGRLHVQKGVDVLIRAAGRVVERVPGATFRIAGDGPERKGLEDMAGREGVGERMEFLGAVDDVREVLAGSRVLVLPSRWEGMPNAALEAMACGRPVVASDVDGCAEVVVDGESGRLVPPEDEEALADAIVEVIGDRQAAERMGRAGRERVERDFTVARMVSAYKELYERCAGSTPS
jgi:glycosyltransferase involved in cell wall biosynthesis